MIPSSVGRDRAHVLAYFSRRRLSPWLVLLLVLVRPAKTVAAEPQTLGEYQIKAGFVFNFTRFVEWPESAFANPTSPLVVCVAGESPLTEPLSDVAVGKTVDGRTLSVRRVRPGDDLRRCHVLFISATEERRTAEMLAGLRKSNTLTVGENPGFVQAGGMINFSIQDNKVKLEMNLEATNHAGVKINSKLIAVSHLISPGSVAEAN